MTSNATNEVAVRPARTVGRRIRAVIVVLAVSLGIVGASAVPAHASLWSLTDGFESGVGGHVSDRWDIERYGNSDGGFEIGTGTARSGSGNAWLTARTSFSAVGREVDITPLFRPRPDIRCGASVYIQAWGPASTVHLAVIDPSTWSGVRNEVTLPQGGYIQVFFPSWSWQLKKVFLRVALIGDGRTNGIRIDDFGVSCSYT